MENSNEDIFVIEKGITEVNQNFSSLCRPIRFPLRLIGAPPSLWRYPQENTEQNLLGKIFTVFMLLLLNLGAVGDIYFTVWTSGEENSTFDQNMNMYFSLAITVSGIVSLDILWWRRREGKKLLYEIDFEPQMCMVIDAQCKITFEKEIRRKTIKMFIFMVIFSGYTNTIYSLSYAKSNDRFTDYTSIKFHINLIIFIFGFIAIYPFAIILSFYISLSWIFRLKVDRIIRYVQGDLEHIENGKIPCSFKAKTIELWYDSYSHHFNKYNLIFEQISGLIYVVMFWSVLSFVEEMIETCLNGKFANMGTVLREDFNLVVLIYFLYSLSSVDYNIKKLVKLLYRLSLRIKFIDSNDRKLQDLSEKYQIIGETISKSGLNLSLFGVMHVSRSLIITTFSLLATYGLLMYELFGNHSKTNDNRINNTTSIPMTNTTTVNHA